MQDYEWLDLAKSLPIGGSRRVRHGAEHRMNMVVQNLPDRWTAYCFACKEHAVKKKDIVKVVEDQNHNAIAPNAPVLHELTSTLCPLRDVVKFLAEKHLSLSMIKAGNPMWDANQKRLCLHLQDVLLGRDIYGCSPCKWYNYSQNKSYALIPKENTEACNTIVLTEDTLSALKISYYTKSILVIACLGTKLNTDLLMYLKEQNLPVCIMLDGDDAGKRGAIDMLRKLNLHGIKSTIVLPPDGKDPKDQSSDWIVNTEKEIHERFSNFRSITN